MIYKNGDDMYFVKIMYMSAVYFIIYSGMLLTCRLHGWYVDLLP